ncbi:hypothetical protein BGZ94_008785 [Podila epigama]|nr:hypothetical protein BGZ94_008785 [Podila epigama]
MVNTDAVTRSLSSCSTDSSSSTSSSSTSSKSVQFSRFIKISFTYPEDEYDRSAIAPAKLTFSEASELLQLRIHWKNEMAKRNRELELQLELEQLQQQQDNDESKDSPSYCKNHSTLTADTTTPTTTTSITTLDHEDDDATVPSISPPHSACSSPEQEHPPLCFRRRLPANRGPLCLLSTRANPQESHSPPCSPILSHHDSCSSSSEDEYDAVPQMHSHSHSHSLSSIQRRLQQIGANRLAISDDQPVQCNA